jgi:hypothetical protein
MIDLLEAPTITVRATGLREQTTLSALEERRRVERRLRCASTGERAQAAGPPLLLPATISVR